MPSYQIDGPRSMSPRELMIASGMREGGVVETGRDLIAAQSMADAERGTVSGSIWKLVGN